MVLTPPLPRADLIWEHQPLLAADRNLLRNIAESELWPKVVFPPFLGGLAVGALGALIGGYDDKPKPKLAAAPPSAGPASGSGSSSGGDEGAGAGASAAAGGAASSALAMEQLKLQAGAVVRPVARALAAVMTLGTGAPRSRGAAATIAGAVVRASLCLGVRSCCCAPALAAQFSSCLPAGSSYPRCHSHTHHRRVAGP